MSFRAIRPSFEESSPSTGTPNQSSESVEAGTSVKRRRPPEHVTKNACTNCKKARAKCDGKTPCGRCNSRLERSECVYEIHVKHMKETLVAQLKEFQARDALVKRIFHALTIDEQVPDVVQSLKAGDSLEAIVSGLTRSEDEILSPRGSQHSGFDASDQEMTDVSSPPRWTSVIDKSEVFHHLFQLYFAWIHPVHTIFSEGHFVESYHNQSHRHCSPALVNAICAIACHLHTPRDNDEIDYGHLESAFLGAVHSAIDPLDKSLTTVQALAILFLIYSAQGKSLKASSYLRLAWEVLMSVSPSDFDGDKEALGNTRRGIQCLSVEWAQTTFQSPFAVSRDRVEHPSETNVLLDKAQWYFYRYVNDQCPAWPGLLVTTNREKRKLIHIIHDAADMMYGQPDNIIQARDILDLYQRYKLWRENLPSSIGNTEDNSQALPHILSLLILHSTAVLQLLRPLLDLEGFPSQVIEGIVWNEAQQGLYLLDNHYQRQWTCRYQPVMQMFEMLQLCDVITRFFPDKLDNELSSKSGQDAVVFAMEALIEARKGFAIVGPFQELLSRTASESSIPFSQKLREKLVSNPARQKFRLDRFMDACTRPSYVQPVHTIQMKYDADFIEDWHTHSPAFGFKELPDGVTRLRPLDSEEARGAQNLMEIRNLLNTN